MPQQICCSVVHDGREFSSLGFTCSCGMQQLSLAQFFFYNMAKINTLVIKNIVYSKSLTFSKDSLLMYAAWACIAVESTDGSLLSHYLYFLSPFLFLSKFESLS